MNASIIISEKNIEIYKNLSQAYEAEFSNLTFKMPDEKGLFELDTFPFHSYVGYLLYFDKIPIGFCVINTKPEMNDIAEFYIIPAMRKKNFGYSFAIEIFDKHPGEWQIKQIKGAIYATQFWRKVIKKYTDNHYAEFIVHDSYWGEVICQKFRTSKKDEY